MKPGKLDNDTLEKLILSRFRKTRPESFGPPRIGMDCAMLDFGDQLIVTSCDPITSADARHIGALSVHVNCNDAAAGGAEPVALLVTLLLPPHETEETVARVAEDLADAAERAGVDIIGGHTEITDAVTRVTTCTTVLAKTPRNGVLSGAVEPVGAVLTIWASSMVIPAMPYLLSFAAGAMMYVVVEELIPEMSAGEHSNTGVLMFALGFSLMMALDVALG